jgi:hypothetical protein
MSNKRKYAEAIVKVGGVCSNHSLHCRKCPRIAKPKPNGCLGGETQFAWAEKWLAKKEAQKKDERTEKRIAETNDTIERALSKLEHNRCTISRTARGSCTAFFNGGCISERACIHKEQSSISTTPWHWPTPDENTPEGAVSWLWNESLNTWLRGAVYKGKDRIVIANPANPDEVPPEDAGMGGKE